MSEILTLTEVLKRVSQAKGREEKIRLLRKYAERFPMLKRFLKFTYRKDIEFELPEGVPPYEPSAATDSFGNAAIWRELKKLDYLVKGNTLSPSKREGIFINMLESVSPTDAELVLQMVSKKIVKPIGISKRLVGDAFPDMFPEKSAG